MIDVPKNFYRVSVKALILNDKKQFLLFQETDGMWELPGGGLDFGESPQDCLKRELKEEAGFEVTWIMPHPSYAVINKSRAGNWKVNIVYEVSVKSLDFTPTDECTDSRFFSKDEIENTHVFKSVYVFAGQFSAENHESSLF